MFPGSALWASLFRLFCGSAVPFAGASRFSAKNTFADPGSFGVLKTLSLCFAKINIGGHHTNREKGRRMGQMENPVRYSVITEKNPREIVMLRGSGCRFLRCRFL